MTKNKNQLLIIIFSIALLFIILWFCFWFFLKQSSTSVSETVYVSEVIDGDTFVLSTGEIIRLLCIDTPENGQVNYQEAKDFLSYLIFLKEIRIEQSKTLDKQDRYNRTLAYVYVNITTENNAENNTEEIFVNKELLDNNLADLYVYQDYQEECKRFLT